MTSSRTTSEGGAAKDGIASWHAADMDRADELFRKALEEERIVDAPQSGSVLQWIAKVHMEKGYLSAAEAAFRTALSQATAAKDQSAEAVILLNYASLLKTIGKTDEALAMYRKSSELAVALGNHRAQAHALGNTANVLRERGEFELSLKLRLEALEILKAHGTTRDLGNSLTNLGNLQRQMGNLKAARESYETASQHLEEAGADRSLVVTRLNRATLLMDGNELEDAADMIASAFTIAEAAELSLLKATAQIHMARLHLKQEQPDAARELSTEVIESDTASEANRVDAFIYSANALVLEGKNEDAKEKLVSAIDLARKTNRHQLTYEALCRLGELYLRDGDVEEATKLANMLPEIPGNSQTAARNGLPFRIRLGISKDLPNVMAMVEQAKSQLRHWSDEGDTETAELLRAVINEATRPQE